MKDAFARSSSLEERKKIAADIQKEVYDQVIWYSARPISSGQCMAEIAHRRDGPATPVFWNIDKSE